MPTATTAKRTTKAPKSSGVAKTKPAGGTGGSYGAADIEVLEGLEAVRRRPSMYIGGVDKTGLHHLIWEVVDNSVDEFLAGHCDRITVTLHKDGSAITVEDNGRGIPVEKHPKFKKSTLEVILTTLHAGGKFSDKNYAVSGGLHGVGSSVVNALSSEMTAYVRRGGHEHVQHYARGLPQGPVKKAREFRGHGTKIFFRPDDEIFRKTHFSADVIKTHLEDISYIHAGLHITFRDEQHGETYELSHPDGIRAYLEKLIVDGKKRPVHEAQFAIEKKEANVRCELALKWTESTEDGIRSYVNGIRTRAGGTHESGLRAGIVKAVKNYIETHAIKIKGVTIGPEDIREGVAAVLSLLHPDPMFQGQTKDKLNNPECSSLVDGMVRQGLETWLNNNTSVADDIIGRIVLAARARQASRDAVKEVRRKSPGRKGSLPGKLMDCRSSAGDSTELYIVEGDSAGGTAAMGRDGKTQAVLPLRGKILNTETLSVSKIMNNAEIAAIVQTLGAGIGPSFEASQVRYGKVILLMDADSDGYHISTLLLTFFFRHMRPLIQSGKLFLAQPPLYKIEAGREKWYVKDDRAKEELIASLPAGRSVDVQRFKGLGEMNPDQLKETTLDPNKRTLLQVDIDSLVDAENTFTELLGKDPSERYRAIMDDAGLIDDLDI